MRAHNPPTPTHDPRDGKVTFDPLKTPELVGSTYRSMLQVIVSKAPSTGCSSCSHATASACSTRQVGTRGGRALGTGCGTKVWLDEPAILDNWGVLASLFCAPSTGWNVLGADLMNEPHGGWTEVATQRTGRRRRAAGQRRLAARAGSCLSRGWGTRVSAPWATSAGRRPMGRGSRGRSGASS